MTPTKEELWLLLSYGWYLHPTMMDVFLKDYETAVGTQTAQIVIYNQLQPDEVIDYRFKADYGNGVFTNELATCCYYIGKFDEYLKEIDHMVDQSYARSLYLNHGVTRRVV